jgi:diguanylate cyclase (GGDEF)-like protein/PAS domain S-box-containing protein
MNPYANIFYSKLLFISGGVSFLIMLTAWKRRRFVSSAVPVALYSLSNVIWCWTYALHWSNLFRPSEFFWLDMTYFGVVLSAPALLIFAFSYTGLPRYLTRRWIALFFVIPVLTLILLWTDPLHGLFFGGKRVNGTSVIFSGGVGFWLNALFLYCCVITALTVLIRAFFHHPRRYFGQMSVVLVGVSLPVTANLLAFLGAYPFPGMDLTPLVFSVTGLFIAIAILRYDFLDIMPISRNVIFEINKNAVFVLDHKKRVVDANQSFRDNFGYQNIDVAGKELNEIHARFPNLPHPSFEEDGETLDFLMEKGEKRFFRMSVHLIKKEKHGTDGYILSINDITREKESEAKLISVNEAIKEQLERVKILQEKLREEAIQDHLTGLYNRRYLQEILSHALPHAEREHSSIAFILFDVDYFKKLNDKYGHMIGDEVLRAFSKTLRENIRKGDIPFRFGGEEFLLLIADATREDVARRVDEIRLIVAESFLVPADESVRVTISAGIATFPEDGSNMDSLFKAADRRLYLAKETGRNHICDWRDEVDHGN